METGNEAIGGYHLRYPAAVKCEESFAVSSGLVPRFVITDFENKGPAINYTVAVLVRESVKKLFNILARSWSLFFSNIPGP